MLVGVSGGDGDLLRAVRRRCSCWSIRCFRNRVICPLVFVFRRGQGLTSLITTPISIFLFSGVQLCMLRVARGQPTSLRYLFQAGPWFFRLLIAGLLFGFAYLIGSFLIVGGVILLCFAWPFPFLILDRNLGAVESLTTALEVTEGNRLTAFLTGLLMIALFPVILVCSCGIGAFVLGPFLQLLPAVFYLLMTGQPTAGKQYR